MRSEHPDRVLEYIASLYAPGDEGLRSVEDRLRAAGRWGINIGAVEGRILQVLMRLAGVRRVVEIGTLFGYSAAWMARALPAEGRLFTIEKDEKCARAAAEGFAACGVSGKITQLTGDALQILPTLENEGPFDMVFIDANKSAYPAYLDWAERNVRAGGLIVADNTLLFGSVVETRPPEGVGQRQWEEMRRFNEMLSDPARFDSIMIPTSEGLSVAVRK